MTALGSSLLIACSDTPVPRNSNTANENDEELVLKALANSEHLRLNNKGLRDLNKLYLCPNVRILHAYENEITDLAPIMQTRLVSAAYLHNNLLTTLPAELGTHMRHLTRLYLNRNRISQFRGWAGVQGAVLEELHLAGQDEKSPLTFEEASLKSLSQCLKVLDVSHNGFTSLKQLLPLRGLRSLFVHHNRIEHVRELTALTDRNPSLVVVSAEENPCTVGVAKLRECKDAVVLSCSAVDVVNGKSVSAAERTFLRERARRLAKADRRL